MGRLPRANDHVIAYFPSLAYLQATAFSRLIGWHSDTELAVDLIT